MPPPPFIAAYIFFFLGKLRRLGHVWATIGFTFPLYTATNIFSSMTNFYCSRMEQDGAIQPTTAWFTSDCDDHEVETDS